MGVSFAIPIETAMSAVQQLKGKGYVARGLLGVNVQEVTRELARSMKLHRDLGMTQTALGVDTENPSGALQLYESMGYEVVSRSTTYRKALANRS